MENIAGVLIPTSKNQLCPCGSGKKFKRCCVLKQNSWTLEITTDAVNALPLPANLEMEDKHIYEEISMSIHKKLNIDLKKVIKKFEALKIKYPDFIRLHNLLGILYQENNQNKKRDDLIIETYQKFPNYLFAKTSIVTLHMSKNDYDKFNEVFEGKYNLKELYPDRKKFHISEALAFFGVCGRYFAHKGEISLAEKYCEMIKTLDPDNPQLKIIRNEILLFSLTQLTRNAQYKIQNI